jgi:hypothetical protein
MHRPAQSKSLANQIDPRYVNHTGRPRLIRRVFIILSVVVALGSWGFLSRNGDARMYNPGPLSAVHARLEHRCGDCHQPAAGGFGMVHHVPDTACLRCHDGAIHHPNQMQLIADDPSRPPPATQRAAGCASCHVEHRGRASLAAVSDAHCTQCHADLSRHTRGGSPRVQAIIRAFGPAGGHPEFGSRLHGSTTAPSDPTVLKFNHGAHVEKFVKDRDRATAAELNEMCAKCHTNRRAGYSGRRSPQRFERANVGDIRPGPDAGHAHDRLAGDQPGPRPDASRYLREALRRLPRLAAQRRLARVRAH